MGWISCRSVVCWVFIAWRLLGSIRGNDGCKTICDLHLKGTFFFFLDG